MLGTDQRELFIPVLNDVIRAQRNAILGRFSFFDIGCGDGQTFALVADEFPDGTTATFLDCNAYYLSQYEAAVRSSGRLRVAQSICAPFLPETAVEAEASTSSSRFTCFIISTIFAHRWRGFTHLLRPGGAAVIVFADEKTAYTGQALRAYHRGDAAFLAAFDETCDLRRRLLLPGTELQKISMSDSRRAAQVCAARFRRAGSTVTR